MTGGGLGSAFFLPANAELGASSVTPSVRHSTSRQVPHSSRTLPRVGLGFRIKPALNLDMVFILLMRTTVSSDPCDSWRRRPRCWLGPSPAGWVAPTHAAGGT